MGMTIDQARALKPGDKLELAGKAWEVVGTGPYGLMLEADIDVELCYMDVPALGFTLAAPEPEPERVEPELVRRLRVLVEPFRAGPCGNLAAVVLNELEGHATPPAPALEPLSEEAVYRFFYDDEQWGGSISRDVARAIYARFGQPKPPAVDLSHVGDYIGGRESAPRSYATEPYNPPAFDREKLRGMIHKEWFECPPEEVFTERLTDAIVAAFPGGFGDAGLREENESLRGSIEEWEADVASLKAEVERLKSRLDSAGAEMQGMYAEVERLRRGWPSKEVHQAIRCANMPPYAGALVLDWLRTLEAK